MTKSSPLKLIFPTDADIKKAIEKKVASQFFSVQSDNDFYRIAFEAGVRWMGTEILKSNKATRIIL